jgi:hypothetical protein
VHAQAYREIREDGHPVVLITGVDLTDIFRDQGFDTVAKIETHLRDNYPH